MKPLAEKIKESKAIIAECDTKMVESTPGSNSHKRLMAKKQKHIKLLAKYAKLHDAAFTFE